MSPRVRGAWGMPGRLRGNTETVLTRSNRPWHTAAVGEAMSPRPTVRHNRIHLLIIRVNLHRDEKLAPTRDRKTTGKVQYQ